MLLALPLHSVFIPFVSKANKSRNNRTLNKVQHAAPEKTVIELYEWAK